MSFLVKFPIFSWNHFFDTSQKHPKSSLIFPKNEVPGRSFLDHFWKISLIFFFDFFHFFVKKVGKYEAKTYFWDFRKRTLSWKWHFFIFYTFWTFLAPNLGPKWRHCPPTLSKLLKDIKPGPPGFHRPLRYLWPRGGHVGPCMSGWPGGGDLTEITVKSPKKNVTDFSNFWIGGLMAQHCPPYSIGAWSIHGMVGVRGWNYQTSWRKWRDSSRFWPKMTVFWLLWQLLPGLPIFQIERYPGGFHRP